MNDDARVIVVGSGPAGAAAATFLVRENVEVLVLEAGLSRSAAGLTVRVGGVTVAKRKKALGQRAGVTLTGDANVDLYEDLAPGGLSNHWSCAVPRFSKEDFEDAKQAGREYTWPVDYEDVAPWYDRVEPLLHLAGSVQHEEQLPRARVRHRVELGEPWPTIADGAAPPGPFSPR